jgi:hypothetical protein
MTLVPLLTSTNWLMLYSPGHDHHEGIVGCDIDFEFASGRGRLCLQASRQAEQERDHHDSFELHDRPRFLEGSSVGIASIEKPTL